MPSLTPSLLRSIVPNLESWPAFVETGTYYGGTIFAMEPLFDELHTIELSEDLWTKARHKRPESRINFHLGDSAEVIPKLAPSLSRPTIFFLDGHWSCGETARGTIDVPVMLELEAICRCFMPPALVIIDDLRLFGQGPHCGEPVDWRGINLGAMREIAGTRASGWVEDQETDKLVIALKELRRS